MNYEDGVGFIILGLFIMIIVIFRAETKLNNAFESGRISEQEYCENFSTSSDIPAACYRYFSVKPVDEECQQVGKSRKCVTKLIHSGEK